MNSTKLLFKRLILPGAIAATVFMFSQSFGPSPKKGKYHSSDEMTRLMIANLPSGENSVFIGSGKCAGCHGNDPLDYANMTSEGVDVNMTDSWRATMMANSAKDPFWRAKVIHEVTVNPEHQVELEDKCTSCHAPQGKYASLYDGNPHYSFAEMLEDSIALDGVACGACHQQRPDFMGLTFSGILNYSPDTVFGPLFEIGEGDIPLFAPAMTSFVGIEPVGHPKVSQSELCAGCHTLITNTVDLEGNLTGGEFVEQATYHEWVNSSYNNDELLQKECQECHMPRLDEPIVVASGYAFLPGRQPYGQHWLVGGNTFMLELMKNRIDELGIAATTEQYDVVIERTVAQLQNETATIELSEGEIDGDTARYTVKLSNLAGHKFPSGYPSRRAYIEFLVTDENGDEIFHSGKLMSNYEVQGQNATWEPHYDIISDDFEEVQIYEMVMGDVNNNVTTVLERADHPIKDNRLVPLGFSTTHFAYDTTLIAGGAETDPNFNFFNGEEGSGTDEIRYHVPVTGVDGQITVTARLMYQSLPPKWNEELFAVDHPTINSFEEMYLEEGADPIEVVSSTVESTVVGIEDSEAWFTVSSNPSPTGIVMIDSGRNSISEISVYSVDGKLINTQKTKGSRFRITLPSTKGSYILVAETSHGTIIRKLLRE